MNKHNRSAYVLSEFTEKSLDSTRKHWAKIAGSDEFDTEYGFVFEWASNHIDYYNENLTSLAYGLFAPKSSEAVAIVEVIQKDRARRGVTKLLKLWITPKLWDVDKSRSALINVTVSAIQGIVLLSKKNHSSSVKIYGRTEQMLSILYSVHARISDSIASGELEGVAVNVVDRWLEFKLSNLGREK